MAENFAYVDVSDLMREWVELGDKEEKNPYMRFMAYWLAFNMLYEGYKTDRSEFAAIRKCYNVYETRFDQYDPFKNNEAEIFMSDAAADIYKRSGDDPEKERGRIERHDRRALLYAIYRVRCNFFHGNKRLGDETDRAFVTSGAIIIRNYLGELGFLPKANNVSLQSD